MSLTAALPRRPLAAAAVAAVLLATAPAAGTAFPSRAVGDLRDYVTGLYATCPLPEGVAVDARSGTVFASSLGVLTLLPQGGFTQLPGPGSLCVVDRGRRVSRIAIPAGPAGTVALFGMDFVPSEGLFVGDGADTLTNPVATGGRVLRVQPTTGRVDTVAADVGAPIGVLRDGRWLYVADGIGGRILRMRPDGGDRRVIAASALLRPAPGSPYGANGLAIDPRGRTLYVPNPGTDRVLTVRLSDGAVRVFADGRQLDRTQRTRYALAGADDVAVDARGTVWVVAGDAEEVQALSPRGRLVARVRGVGVDATRAPTALAFLGRRLVVTNFDARSATPGANSKLSILRTPLAGLRR